jgi:DNA polymerase bacteriophage-type
MKRGAMSEGLHCDLESRSTVDLRKTNVGVYAEHPTTDVICLAYAFGSAEPEIWLPPQPCPPKIAEHVVSGGLVYAWNCNFERVMWREILSPRYGFPMLQIEQCRCVMAQAYALALPGALENAAIVLGLSQLKDDAGKRLMLRMCRPRQPKKNEKPGLCWWDDPADLARLVDYCKNDVVVERAIFDRLLPLNDIEQKVWQLDARINDRGVYIDVELCHAANKIVDQTVRKLNQELAQITDYEVRGLSNTAELIRFVRKHGIDADSIAKDKVIDLLIRDDLPAAVRRALEIRQEGAKTSVAKINAMLARRQADGRMRYNLQYHGAGTGRWAARGAQLQNLPRPSMKGDLSRVIDDLMLGDAEVIEVLHGPPLSVVSDCIRGMIAAP